MGGDFELLLIADDLTGALDTGAQFARRGLRALVAWGDVPEAEADVWVLDTESRDRPPAEAARRVVEAATPLLPRARRIYKKVDSTLRGNCGAELQSLLEASGAPRAILSPAFPAQGRTTLAGVQHVHGTPLAGSPFAQPGLDCSTIASLLHGQTDLATRCIGLEAVRRGPEALAALLQACSEPILVVDALEDADLATLAQAAALAGQDRLLAGSAGLAAQLPVTGARKAGPRAAVAEDEAILFVAGTQHASLGEQLMALQAQAPVTVVGQVLGGLLVRGDRIVAERSRALAALLLAGSDAVLTCHGEPLVAGAGRLVAGLLAEVAGRALAQAPAGALVLTGGDAAIATCRALAASGIAIEGELEPGIPVGRLVGGAADGVTVVTKAGGFGDEAVLSRVWSALRQQAG